LPHVVEARHEAFAAIWEATGWKYTRVAIFFGRYHTSVMYGIGSYLFKQGRRDGPVQTYLTKATRRKPHYVWKNAA